MEKELRIIIAGSREFVDYAMLKREAASIISSAVAKRRGNQAANNIPKELITIVSGGARGADKLGEQFAREFGFRLKQFPADWKQYGKKAGFIRNGEMAKYAEEAVCDGMLIAFWDGESMGTKHMIDLAKYCGLEIYIVNFIERQNTHIPPYVVADQSPETEAEVER